MAPPRVAAAAIWPCAAAVRPWAPAAQAPASARSPRVWDGRRVALEWQRRAVVVVGTATVRQAAAAAMPQWPGMQPTVDETMAVARRGAGRAGRQAGASPTGSQRMKAYRTPGRHRCGRRPSLHRPSLRHPSLRRPSLRRPCRHPCHLCRRPCCGRWRHRTTSVSAASSVAAEGAMADPGRTEAPLRPMAASSVVDPSACCLQCSAPRAVRGPAATVLAYVCKGL